MVLPWTTYTHTGLDGCLRILLSCFRKMMSVHSGRLACGIQWWSARGKGHGKGEEEEEEEEEGRERNSNSKMMPWPAGCPQSTQIFQGCPNAFHTGHEIMQNGVWGMIYWSISGMDQSNSNFWWKSFGSPCIGWGHRMWHRHQCGPCGLLFNFLCKILHSHPVQGDSSALRPGLCWLTFGEFLWLVGRYCSYLLPKQDGGTSQIKVNPTQVLGQMNYPVHW